MRSQIWLCTILLVQQPSGVQSKVRWSIGNDSFAFSLYADTHIFEHKSQTPQERLLFRCGIWSFQNKRNAINHSILNASTVFFFFFFWTNVRQSYSLIKRRINQMKNKTTERGLLEVEKLIQTAYADVGFSCLLSLKLLFRLLFYIMKKIASTIARALLCSC